ncbi:hypothetical protein B0H11DRAFT_786537 [Mycena galericulata]|nr:hypothetical protein B0H11DRAFT_786537 [Mycena galericulata]
MARLISLLTTCAGASIVGAQILANCGGTEYYTELACSRSVLNARTQSVNSIRVSTTISSVPSRAPTYLRLAR